MKLESLLPLLVTATIAVLGWIIAHRFTSARDLASKRRELRTKYLVEAFRELVSALGKPATTENLSKIELAITDLQLFGSPEQADKAAAYASSVGGRTIENIDIGDLIVQVRDALRTDLGLPPAKTKLAVVRLSPAGDGTQSQQ